MSLTPLWLFILGVLLIETALRVMPEGYMTRTMQHRIEEMRYLDAADVQLMGDSATTGFRAQLIQSAIGGTTSVKNYAIPGASPLFAYFILQRQIAEGKIPKVIVLAPNPFMWTNPCVDSYLARLATPKESYELLSSKVSLTDWLYGTLCRFSYTLRYRDELYKTVTAGDKGFFKTLTTPVLSVQLTRANTLRDEDEPPPPEKSLLSKATAPPVFRTPIKFHPYNQIFVDKLCTLAARHGIKVVSVRLPVPEMIRRDFPAENRFDEYDRFMTAMAEKHSNFTRMDTGVYEMPDTYFLDPWHYNSFGIWKFSKLLGESLSKSPHIKTLGATPAK